MNVKTLKYRSLAALFAVVFGMGTAWAVNNIPADGTITVTPVGSVALALDVTTYAFGNIDVNTSTNSATALQLSNVTNLGGVSVKVDKKILDDSAPDGWTAKSTTGLDQYVLYCATSAAHVELADFKSGTEFLADAVSNKLTGSDGVGDPTIAPGGNVKLWFRLDMPSSVSSQAARTITVRFTATAQ